MKVLVTGGSGFVGKRLQKIRPEWIYLSSTDCDLTSKCTVSRMLEKHNPDAVIHLAGKVGGIKDNSEKQGEYFYINTAMNINIVECCRVMGIKRLLASLSTCAFPDVGDKYPFTEEDILKGPPAETNLSYGYSKRNLYVMINAYRKQYGLNYSTFCPSNVYGPDDDFNSEKSHFVPAMIRKFINARDIYNTLDFWGTGKPMRQQLYVDDLAFLIPVLLKHHNTDIPIIVAPDENLTIKEMIELCQSKILGKDGKKLKYTFNGQLDGQYRKDGSNGRFMDLIHEHLHTREFYPFECGLRDTIKWYMENK